tara:strand:+ start:12303 stop:15914 length:3612 start_codon:yes stop_codon:yes gene_type:complete
MADEILEDPLQQEDEPNVFMDVLAAPFRGVEGALQSTYGLADFVVGDILPDWDTRVLGRSKTFAGGIVEGGTQFLSGFIPIFGAASKAGALAKAGTFAQKAMQNNMVKSAYAGVLTDFTVFSEQEQRLSNLIQEHPALANPVTEFLAAKEDDSVIEGRLKNALEGLGLGLITDGMVRGIKAIRNTRKARADGLSPDEAALKAKEPFDDAEEVLNQSIGEGGKDLPKTVEEEVDEVIKKAAGEEPVTPKESDLFEYDYDNPENTPIPTTREFRREEIKTLAKGIVRREADRLASGDQTLTPQQFPHFADSADRMAFTEEIANAMRELKKEQVEAGVLQRKSFATLEEEIDDVLADQGWMPNKMIRNFKNAGARKAAQEHSDKVIDEVTGKAKGKFEDLEAHVQAVRVVLGDKVAQLDEVAKGLKGLSDVEVRGQIVALTDQIWDLMLDEQQYASGYGRGLNRTKKFRKRKSKDNLKDVKTGGQVFNEQFLRNRKEEWVKQVVDIVRRGGTQEQIMKKVLNIVEETRGGWLDVTKEFFINNILSGPPTQMINLMGGALATALDTFEQSAGALMIGRPDIAKQALKAAWDMDALRESLHWAGQAAKHDRQFLIPSSDIIADVGERGAINSRNLGIAEDSSLYNAVNQIGEVLRYPGRGLSTVDEFFKQINARRAMKFKASVEAIEAGISDPTEIAKYVHNKIEKVITQGGELYSQHTVAKEGFLKARQRELSDEATITYVNKYVKNNFDENASQLADYAQDVAEQVTFTKDLDPDSLSGGLHTLVKKNPVLGFVVPFIRTPVNIMSYAVNRTPFQALRVKEMVNLRADIRSANPMRQAAAKGRIATSAAALATMGVTFTQFSDRITGGGPRDAKRRRRLEESGWQPYSIKMPDGSYVSYQRLDPLATIIGVYADTNDMLREGGGLNSSIAEHMMMSMLIAIQRNITNKSYLAGIEQFTEALSDESGKGIERFVSNLAVGGLIPFSGAIRTAGQSVTGEIMGINEAKELRNIGDRLRQFVPFDTPLGKSGLKLDPRRNLLGEEKEIEGLFGHRISNALSPIRYKSAKDDAVLEEIAQLDHAFSEPSPTYQGLIDLTEYTKPNGQSAHDRRLELMSTVRIDGKTLRQSLDQLIKSKEYQQHSPRSEPALPSPRIGMINKLLRKYRTEGLSQALREYPELKEFQQQLSEVQARQKQGQALDNLIQTLEF